MKNQTLIAGIAVVVVAVGAWWYLGLSSAPNTTVMQDVSTSPSVEIKDPVDEKPTTTIDSASQVAVTGTAKNTSSVAVNIIATTPAKSSGYTTLYGKGNVIVINGHWSLAIPANTFD